MAPKAARIVAVVLVSVAVLLAVAAVLHVYESEPMDDMRQRADAMPLPKGFVLVSESYSEGGLGIFGAVPHLERVYHAPWPGLCDTLRDVGSRLGAPTGLALVPKQYAEHMCNCGAWYGTGWRGWIRNYHHYDVRFSAWQPGFAQGPMFESPHGFLLLYPRIDVAASMKIVIPEGRARVAVELIAHRGQ